jgi:hypothetical protein
MNPSHLHIEMRQAKITPIKKLIIPRGMFIMMENISNVKKKVPRVQESHFFGVSPFQKSIFLTFYLVSICFFYVKMKVN